MGKGFQILLKNKMKWLKIEETKFTYFENKTLCRFNIC